MKHILAHERRLGRTVALAYDEMFLLRLFAAGKPLKETSVFYILQGKRTASMLYRAVDYSLEPIFGFLPKLDRTTYQKKLHHLITVNYLSFMEESQELVLTAEGKAALEAYFAEHYEPLHLNWLTEGKTVTDFQKVIYFLTQIFSEARYSNKRYIPIEKNTVIQQWVKRWLHRQSKPPHELGVQFGSEWKKVLSQLEPNNAVIVVQLMSGHGSSGFTRAQIAQQLHLEETEIRVRLLDTLNFIVQYSLANKEAVPLFASILLELRQKNQKGLSKSALDTLVLLQQGYSLEQICQIRKLKKSTVSEHIIECVIVEPSMKVCDFIPEEVYGALQQLFEKRPHLTHQEAAEIIPDMEFYWFRIMQIERRRINERN